MGESDVELGGASVACIADGHMSRKTGDTNDEAENANSNNAASNTRGFYPSLDADAVESGATEQTTSGSDYVPPEQFAAEESDRGRKSRRTPETQSPPPAPEADTPTIISSPGSRSPSDSEATIIPSGTQRTRSDMKIAAEDPLLKTPGPSPPTPRPDPLNFLEPDSPAVTPESIRRSIEASTARWKSSRPVRDFPSKLSSDPGTSTHSVFSQTDPSTTRSSTLGHGSPMPRRDFRPVTDRANPKGYGAPEMYPGLVGYPQIPGRVLRQHLPVHSDYNKRVSRGEKAPPSGYQLLASKLSSGHPNSHLQPIYRRFETLAHRVLLHLQDELSELEEQLDRLDAADAQVQGLQAFIQPASRRADAIVGGELQWHRTDVLGKIGYKLEQYSTPPLHPSIFRNAEILTCGDRVLASFVKTQGLAGPSAAETEEYFTFLETHKPVAEPETRFLGFPDDLVVLRGHGPGDCLSSGASTPMPVAEPPFPCTVETQATESKTTAPLPPPHHEVSTTSIAASIAITTLLPLLSFGSFRAFPSRAAVIWLVALGVLNPLLRASGLRGTTVGSRDALLWTGVYGGAMCAVAALVS